MQTILYLVHDLLDPAVGRRVAMLRAGGAEVVLAGFKRGGAMPNVGLAPERTISLGETRDGAFGQRIAKVAATLLSKRATHLASFAPTIVVARNLEMLALAVQVARKVRPRPRLVYETLDIHRLLLGQGPAGMALRALERRLARHTSLVLTSSPAFVENYLKPVQGFARIRVEENKVLDLGNAIGGDAVEPEVKVARPATNALRIGWFGALRCTRSLGILSEIARTGEGRFDVTLRGRPSSREFPDLKRTVAGRPHLAFLGSYRPQDLPQIYGAVDFAWAIDFFEDGLNSAWLLPNRVYEGCAYGAIPIARAGTQTARFLERLDIGVVVDSDDPSAIAARLRGADLSLLRARMRAVPPGTFRAGRDDCRALVAALAGVPAQRAALGRSVV